MSTAAQLDTGHQLEHHHQDHTGAKIGMWLFLFTELLMFGSLFLVYSDYRMQFPEDFHYSASTLDPLVGTINTLILLTSSLTMALAIAALDRYKVKVSARLLGVTILLGGVFLVNKYFEWSAKFAHDLYPGSETLSMMAEGERQFFNLYYAMTGLHGIHVLAGMVVIAFMLYFVARKPRQRHLLLDPKPARVALQDESGRDLAVLPAEGHLHEVQLTLVYEKNEELSGQQLIRLENTGLFWHLVDLIWIFLFPLFYLIT
jgi:cytochrome c oxidase subunit 3